MNRNEEYLDLVKELEENTPDLRVSVQKARSRRTRITVLYRSLASIAACFAIFVLLVNFSKPVAYACSQIPVLRELAEAVTFSKSLTDAVENEYVQIMDLSQSKNDITAEIDYLIVDQKQVNVFYRLDSDKYEQLVTDLEILDTNGKSPILCGYSDSGYNGVNGELRCLSIDFAEDNVPGSLIIKLNVYTNQVDFANMTSENSEDGYFDDVYEEPDYLASFEFLLEFDPKFTASGKAFPLNQTVILEGQEITITDIEVYPSHIRVDVEESADNTAWLIDLDFYIETDLGMKFEPVSSGITATGLGDSPSMVSYRADSTYFYEAEHLKLVITGAKWLRKDMETTYVNLVTGETGELPEGTVFEAAERGDNGWVVTFRADLEEDEPMYQLFRNLFYDADGNEYEINMWSSMYGDEDEEGNITYYLNQFLLKNYPYDEVWLSPQYSHYEIVEDLIVITIQ